LVILSRMDTILHKWEIRMVMATRDKGRIEIMVMDNMEIGSMEITATTIIRAIDLMVDEERNVNTEMGEEIEVREHT
jgi:hypothetical protein